MNNLGVVFKKEEVLKKEEYFSKWQNFASDMKRKIVSIFQLNIRLKKDLEKFPFFNQIK